MAQGSYFGLSDLPNATVGADGCLLTEASFLTLRPTHCLETAVRQHDVAHVPVHGISSNILCTVTAPHEEARDKHCAPVLRDRQPQLLRSAPASSPPLGSMACFCASNSAFLTLRSQGDNFGEKLLEGRSPQREEETSCCKLAPRCCKLACTPPCFHTNASEFLRRLLGYFPSRVVEQERDRHGSHRFHQRAQSGRRRWAHGLFARARQ